MEPTAQKKLKSNPDLENEIKTLSDGTKYLLNPKNILSGGPPKDGIPHIDNPQYNPIEGISWIEDNELVLAIEYKGIKRVYPLQIMVWHEIVNDFFGDERVLITYCPLCGSGIAYKPVIEVDGVKKEVEFGKQLKSCRILFLMPYQLEKRFYHLTDNFVC